MENNNIEQVPESVFDWLQQYDFAVLTETQQKEVLRYFTKEEYDELHRITQLVKTDQGRIASGISQKEMLLQQFDKKHSRGRSIVSLWDRPVALWKVAAVFFLCGLVWMQYYLFQQKKPASFQLMAGCDTVYITKEADTIRIYDTVYNTQTVAAGKSSVKKQIKAPANEEYYRNEQVLSPNLNIISIQEAESLPNRRKGNCIKDDTLIKNHPFVTL